MRAPKKGLWKLSGSPQDTLNALKKSSRNPQEAPWEVLKSPEGLLKKPSRGPQEALRKP